LNRATVFNATDRRTYERELLAARTKAEEIARAKADTLNMVSHDIRNLLAGILGATRRLQSGELAPDQQQRYLGLLRASADSMMLLANNLLEVSRLEAEASLGWLRLRSHVTQRSAIGDAKCLIRKAWRYRGRASRGADRL